MESSGKDAGALTPAKDPHSNPSKFSQIPKDSENSNPNIRSPALKPSKSPVIKSATKTPKSASKNPNPIGSPAPRNKIRERKFLVAKRNSNRENENPSIACKCKNKAGGNSRKCLCVAYENLRASQEEFFKRGSINDQFDSEELGNFRRGETGVEGEGQEKNPIELANGYEGRPEEVDCSAGNGSYIEDPDGTEHSDEMGFKRRRDILMEESRNSVPEAGFGRVTHLVKAFDRLLTIPKSEDSDQQNSKELDDNKKAMKWALPGLQQPKMPQTQVSASSFCPSDYVLTSESLGLNSHVSSSLNSSQGSFNSKIPRGGRRSRHNSGSSGTFGGSRWKRRQLKATSQKPFKLRTEQRGKCKEEEFIKKGQQMMMEEEKLRIPVAQGLPWTTDEPECLVKPPVKESTIPIDLKLHSDIRAVERAEFDQQVAEKMCLIEQYRMEKERQRKLAEEEEIRRLRKELVPRAQPMPYFDRPFIPRRSMKQPTVPRDPYTTI